METPTPTVNGTLARPRCAGLQKGLNRSAIANNRVKQAHSSLSDDGDRREPGRRLRVYVGTRRDILFGFAGSRVRGFEGVLLILHSIGTVCTRGAFHI